MEKRSPLLALNALYLVLLLLFIVMANDTSQQAAAQVFCRSQFNLANEACSLRTFSGVNPTLPMQSNESTSGDYQLQASRGDDHGHGNDHDHSHHHHGHHADPYDTACCRRLMGIDNACICQAMSFLPVFMSRVKHAIKLTPVPGCDVSFECAAAY